MKAKNTVLITEIVENFDQNELNYMFIATLEHMQREKRKYQMADGGLNRAILLKEFRDKITKTMKLIHESENNLENEKKEIR